MKYAMEVHRYAPEMNKVYRIRATGDTVLIGTSLEKGQRFVKSFANLKEFRALHRKVTPGVVAVIKTHYSNSEQKCLERTYQGRVKTRSEALLFAAEQREKLAPGGKLSVRTYLVG